MSLSSAAWISSTWDHYRSVTPTAENARRSNPYANPPVPPHTVPYEIIRAFVDSLHGEVTAEATTATALILPGGAKSGAPSPVGPLVSLTALVPSAASLGDTYRASVGALGSRGVAAKAIVEGAFDYFLANAQIQFDPLSGWATATGSLDSAGFGASLLRERLRTALAATGYFSAGDLGVALTTQMEQYFVLRLSEISKTGVEGSQQPVILWTGTPDPSPTSNTTDLEVSGTFQ